jgi:hypothetical protein
MKENMKTKRNADDLQAQEQRKSNGSKDTDNREGSLGIQRSIQATEQKLWLKKKAWCGLVVIEFIVAVLVDKGEAGERGDFRL